MLGVVRGSGSLRQVDRCVESQHTTDIDNQVNRFFNTKSLYDFAHLAARGVENILSIEVDIRLQVFAYTLGPALFSLSVGLQCGTIRGGRCLQLRLNLFKFLRELLDLILPGLELRFERGSLLLNVCCVEQGGLEVDYRNFSLGNRLLRQCDEAQGRRDNPLTEAHLGQNSYLSDARGVDLTGPRKFYFGMAQRVETTSQCLGWCSK